MAMARNRRAGCVVTALQADHLGHQLALHPEPNTDAQRQQPLLRRTGRLARRLLHTIGQRIERPSPIAPAFCSMAYAHLASVFKDDDDRDPAIEWGERALELAERLQDRETMIHALATVGAVQLDAGDPHRDVAEYVRSRVPSPSCACPARPPCRGSTPW